MSLLKWLRATALGTGLVLLGLCAPRSVGTEGKPIPPNPPEPVYNWPLDAVPVVTSGHGEYRSRHNHGGIDIRTPNGVGMAIHSLADGWIYRINSSYTGYGRVLYIRQDDGRFAVYAHLSAFGEKARAVEEKQQFARDIFGVDDTLPPDSLRVRKGEVVAYSGESGAGPPHLHLELRTPNNDPIHPLLHGIKVTDTRNPVIHKIICYPMGQGSLVNGKREPTVLPLVGRGPNRYGAAKTLRIQGNAVFCIAADDYIGKTGHTTIPARYWLTVDRDTLYAALYDTFSTKYIREAEEVWDGFLLRHGYGQYQRLWQMRPLHLAIRRPQYGEGILNGKQWTGTHTVRIVAEDPAGLRAEAEITISGEAPLEPDRDRGQAERNNPPEVVYRPEGLSVKLDNAGAAADWNLELTRGEIKMGLLPFQAGPGAVEAYLPAGPGDLFDATLLAENTKTGIRYEVGVMLHTARPGEAGGVTSDDGRFMLEFADSTLIEPVWYSLQRKSPSSIIAAFSATDIYELGPDNWLFLYPTRVSFDVRGLRDPDKLCLVRNPGASQSVVPWSFSVDSSTLSGYVVYLEPMMLQYDRTPPVLKPQLPKARTKGPRPRMEARVFDRLSGFSDYGCLSVFLDGDWLVPEYDPEKSLMWAYPRKDLSPGSHTVLFVAKDRCGNKSTAKLSFISK